MDAVRAALTILVAGLLLVAFAVLGYRERSSGGHDASRSIIEKLFRMRRKATESDCFRVLIAKEEVGRLTSPGHPDSYPANADCRWLLTTLDENDTISLVIDTLAIEPERDCALDSLQIYLGSDPSTSPLLGRFCGIVRDRVLETNSSRVLLVFHSDLAYEDRGFAIDYFVKSAGDCKKSLGGDSGSFTSPGFPKGYPDGTDCSTLIEVQPGRKVALQFDSVDLEPGENCTFDYVRIHDGSSHNATLLGQICQGTDTRTFESSSGSLLVHFHSDDSVNRRGFRARYNSVDARSSPVGDCLWDAGERNGSVSSPNYPESYPSFANCSLWLLAPEGWRVLLKIDALLLEVDANCSYDFLQIEEGGEEGSKVLGRFCGRSASEPRRLVSNNNEVRIRFQSDQFVEFLGFKLSYEFFKEERREGTAEEYIDDSSEETLAFSVTPQDASLPLGSSHSLQCGVQHPNAKIRWLKGEMFLAGDSPLPSLKVLPNDTLWIQSMGHHLAGRYTCVAVSPEGAINATADIRVQDGDDGCKLEFWTTPQDSEVEEGDFVLLECLAPDAHVTWERGGRPLPERDHVTVLKSGHVFVDGAEMDDAGLYTCVARDVRGTGCEQRAHARLTVHARPDIDKICGLSRVAEKKPTAEGNIVGGHDAEKGAYPWQVMLWEPKRQSFCGATLLDERWILTAAHCVNRPDIPWHSIRIKLGKHDREREEDEEFETSIADPSDIKLHPGYRSLHTFDNDLAVVRMRDRAPFTDRILPACLGDRNLTERLLISSGRPRMGTVVGWGKLNQHGGLPRFLQEIQLPLVDPLLCQRSTRQTVTRNMFCAGYAQEVIGDACQGDSGGPFLMKHEGRWYVVGVVSWGEGCGQKNKYGFYTRVANHLSWIKGYVKS